MELALKLYINKAPSEKKYWLSIVWNKPYQTYITLRATWIEKYPCMFVLLCRSAFAKPDCIPGQSRGESFRFLDINGQRNGIDCLLESDLCVQVVSILCFLRLDAATLKTKDRVFLSFRHSSLYLYTQIITIQISSKDLAHISFYFGEGGRVEGKENAEIASFSQSETYTGPSLEFGQIRVNHVDSNG